MRAEKILFDEAVRIRNVGSRLPDNAVERSDGALQLIKEFEDRQIDGFRRSDFAARLLPRVLVDYVDNPGIGGWAFFHQDSYILSVSIGALKTTRFLFNRLMASPDVFPTVGNASKETKNLPVIPLTMSFSDLQARIQKEGYSWKAFVPKDAVRRSIADFMFFNAILFLLGHEFRHIQAGHLDFARDVLKLSSIHELPFIGSSERDSMACQALELDADNCAMYSLLKHWCNQIEVLDQNPEELRETLSRRDVFLSIFMVSCCGLFRVFDTFDKPPPTSWPYLSHPPSRVRRLFLLANAENYIQAEGKAHLFPSHGVVSPELVSLLEEDSQEIWGQGFDETYSTKVFSELGPRHLSEIKKMGKTIGSDVAKYSFITSLGDFF